MAKDKFEGWCTPVSIGDLDLGKYADHTFVYCPNHNSSFKCWGTADRKASDAAKVCSHSDSKACCRANKYRISVGGCKDTAGVGVYAVNGVCHQSANLFLYAVGTILPLNKSRPKGILASHALFGMYGADLPGDVPSFVTHFAAWNVGIYAQASVRCWFSLAKSLNIPSGSHQELISKITKLHLERSSVAAASTNDEKLSLSLVPQEMQLMLSHYLPEVDNSIVRKVHKEIMERKDQIFSKYGLVLSAEMKTAKKLPSGKDVDGMVEKLNGLALEFQSQLAEKLGAADYKKINGDNNYYSPIDPEIAKQAMDSAASE
jgi:hypothetical protein